MVWEDLTPNKILTPPAFDNSIRVHMALGGSTNAIVHVVAMARRAGIALDTGPLRRDFTRSCRCIANVRPSGKFLMEDFYYAGGLRALMAELRGLLDLDCMTITGKTVGEYIAERRVYNAEVIRPLYDPISRRRAPRC